MKNRCFTFVAGMLMGAVLFSGGVAHAADIFYKAIPSTNPVYLDGQRVELAAFAINGNNYVKLRDVGELMGFNVYWGGAVQIDSDAPYTGVAPAAETQVESIRVSCYKEGPLRVGDSSGLMLYPSGVEYTVTSSNPAAVTVEKALGKFWKANAVGPGTAVITASAPDGRTGSVSITVKAAEAVSPAGEPAATLAGNMEIRQEMIRLINQTRKENGVSELSINDALMNAAQTCSDRRYTWHHTQEECEAVAAAGYPYGFGTNLTVFTGVAGEDIAQHAVENWIRSPGHFQTMIDPDCDSIGVGVTDIGTVTYCYMFVGNPNSVNPYT